MSRLEAEAVAEAIKARIIEVGKLDPASLRPNTELIHELGMSSLELLSVLAFAEQRYGIAIKDEDLVSLTTLSKIVAKVEELLP
jgi:acyl carrier protein